MRIIVQLKPDAVREIRTRKTREAKAKVLGWLDRTLTPVHVSTADPSLASFFVLDVEDAGEAQRLVTRLLKDRSVEAAYIKPDDELPSM